MLHLFRNIFSTLFLLTVTVQLSFGQNYKVIDSLRQALKKTTDDTTVIEIHEDIFWEYYGVYNDTALIWAKKISAYATPKKFQLGILNGYRLTGMAYSRLSNHTEALRYQQMALKQCDVVNDPGQKANILNNLANIHYELKEYKAALKYQERSLDICQKLNIKRGIAANYGNMGNIYKNLGNTNAALAYYKKSLALDKEMKNAMGYANSLGNIGQLYVKQKKYSEAIKYYNESLKVRDSIGFTDGIASSYISLGDVYNETGDPKKAEDYFLRALSLAEESGSLEQQESCYDGLHQAYKKLGKINEALDAFEKYDLFKDSIMNTSRLDELNALKTQYIIDQKENEQKIKIEKFKAERNAEQRAEKKQRNIIIISSIAGIIFLSIFLFVIFKRYKLSLRQQEIIQSQKKLVEVKNKEITDSINYAKRIQEAMLTSENDFKQLLPHSFVLFRPKDIVSGDFYWITQLPKTNQVIFALGDCTGHGVPGGFMSVLGINLLNEIVNEKQVHEPAAILNLLRTRVITSLKQDGSEGNSRDGMDISIGKIDTVNGDFTFASANRMMYAYSNGTLLRYKGNAMPVGYYEKDKTFTQEQIKLNKGDYVYFFTDGFVDQIGGDDGRKFKYPNFEAAITTAISEGKALDKKYFEDIFISWKKDRIQVDDVSMIGVKI